MNEVEFPSWILDIQPPYPSFTRITANTIIKPDPKKDHNVYYLYDYQPYWKKQGDERFRNTNFNDDSRFIWSFKDGDQSSINHVYSIFDKIIQDNFTIVTIPSHDPSKKESSIKQLGKMLAMSKAFASFYRKDGTECLIRNQPIPSLHSGGSRSQEVLLKSLKVQNQDAFYHRNVLLLDDVATSGNSLRTARRILLEYSASGVYTLLVGRTKFA